MESALKKIGLLLLIMCLLMSRSYAQRGSQRKDELIQDTVRKFLGVKSDERTGAPAKAQSLPPQYLMDLYERYRSGHSPMQGNTVRSILAMREKIADVDMLIFNLTGLKSTEQILQSKLYLLKRRRPKGGKKRENSSFRLTIGCLPNMTSKHHIEISLARQKPEWHSYDISESVVSCRQTRKGKDSLLGLTLEIKRPKGKHRLVAFKRLIKPNSQPFVLIFSEDSQNQTNNPTSTRHDGYDELGDLLRARANQEGILPEGIRLPQTPGRNHRHRGRRSIDYENSIVEEDSTLKHHKNPSSIFHSVYNLQKYINAASQNFDLNITLRADFVRLLRHVIDKLRYFLNANEHVHQIHPTEIFTMGTNHQSTDILPEAPELFISANYNTSKKVLHFVHQLHKQNDESQNEMIRLSKRPTRSIADTLRYSTEVKESNDSEATVQTIQVIDEDYSEKQNSNLYPKSRRRNRKRKMHETPRKHKKKRRRNRKLPFWWTRHDSRLHAQDLKQMCQRKSLVVDFTQLGWDEWIISPKSFNAHYCEGSCTFPTIKHTETSNHAAVQSLVHAMGLNTNIPTPCCVPSVTSSLTLLYFDEHGSLILKSYPNMIVEKCGCR